MFAIGIIALSLVPLVGFAGQISLCQLSFAGIGAVMMAHMGSGNSLVGLVAAVAVCAAVGALVALPALRLSGIYLALATAAFAVFLDRWIFTLPNFNVGPVDVKLFESGSVRVASLDFWGWRLGSVRAQMAVAVVVFVAVAALVMVIRRSGYGRRLLAIRDSEAACATFGLNLLWARLSVFMISAAIAGLGGAIYATQLTSITAGQFQFFTGLPIFMMVVVGGAGFVGGALFAGVALYGALPLITGLWASFAKWSTIGTGVVGISLGRQPSGAAPQFSEGFAPLRDDRPVLVATLGGLTLAWVLRLVGVYQGWGMVAAMAVIGLGGIAVAMRRALVVAATEVTEETAQAQPGVVPLEWVGITVPWTNEHIAELDRHLDLSEFFVAGQASARLGPVETIEQGAGRAAP